MLTATAQVPLCSGAVTSVQVGNVTEFNQPWLPPGLESDFLHDHLVGGDEYASMAPFYTEDPGLVVIPGAQQEDLDRWADIQATTLRWQTFEPLAWNGDSRNLSAALGADPAVRKEIERGCTFVPWGETLGFREFIRQSGGEAVLSTDASVVATTESKIASAILFETALEMTGYPLGLRLAEQSIHHNDSTLIEALCNLGRVGKPAVLKAPHGVGGYGSVVLEAHETASATRAHRAITSARNCDGLLDVLPLIIQEYIWKIMPESGDVTVDYEIDAAGRVECRGSASMIVDGTHYAGAVTADGTVFPGHQTELVESFGRAVGVALAGYGYRGWFDVDFVRAADTTLVPIEVNARRTGPTIALMIRNRLEAISGNEIAVCAHDNLPLRSRLPPRAAFDLFMSISRSLGLSGKVVPTLTTATESIRPYMGIAIQASTATVALAQVGAFRHALLG